MPALLFPTRLKNVSALYVIGSTFALEISFQQADEWMWIAPWEKEAKP